MPEEGQRDADQQRGRPGVGPVEDAVRVHRVEEDRHQQARGDRARDHADHDAPVTEPRHEEREGDGPEQVELLLDRQRPEVAEQGGPGELLEVGLVAQDQVPVGHVGHRGQRLAAERGDLSEVEERAGDHHHGDQHPDRRQQPPRAPQPERDEVDSPLLAELAEQQRGDQVAADDEEDVDPEEPAGKPPAPVVEVVDEHGQHGDGTQAIQAGHVGQSLAAAGRHRTTSPGMEATQSRLDQPRQRTCRTYMRTLEEPVLCRPATKLAAMSGTPGR